MSISGTVNPEPTPTEWSTSDSQAPVGASEQSPGNSSAPQTVQTPSEAPAETSQKASADDIMAALMKSIGDIGTKANFKIMVYGDPGSTKSSFTATAPSNLIYDTEDGALAARNSPNGIAEGVQTIPFKSWMQSEILLQKLIEGNNELDRFSVFSVDTLSELHKRGLAEVTEKEWKKSPSRNRYVPETEHHQENNEKILRFVRDLRDLKRDLIITAHAKTVEPKNKPAKTYSDFSESLSNKLMAFMDIVGYMYMKQIDGKTVPVMRVVSNGTIHAKTRINLPEEIVNPTYPQLRRAWEEQMKKEQ